MDLMQAFETRHSVRAYLDTPIPEDIVLQLQEEIDNCNKEGDLNIQLIAEEPEAFDSFMAHYGKFTGVKNYIALIGKKSGDLSERCGYYGERLVIKAQMLGLNSCWVALTFSKRKAKYTVGKGEKMVCVIALGYGENPGKPHINRSIDKLTDFRGDMPHWFMDGVMLAMKAPTARNQQKFCFRLEGESKVHAFSQGGAYSDVDLGIVKYHFEIGSGKENFEYV
ncbi:MAG: nitroreductase [Clostridiales bacterium]|nr:nitroreductase [Clostridiales bacterium]